MRQTSGLIGRGNHLIGTHVDLVGFGEADGEGDAVGEGVADGEGVGVGGGAVRSFHTKSFPV